MAWAPAPTITNGTIIVSDRLVPGDADGDGDVDDGDCGNLFAQFGMMDPTDTLTADFNRDGVVDVEDVTILQEHFGDTLPSPAPQAHAAPQADANLTAAEDDSRQTNEPVPATAAPVAVVPIIPVVRQSLSDSDVDETPISARASVPAVDLIVESPWGGSCLSEPQTVAVGSSATTLYRTATAEYDLWSLGDDLPTEVEDDLLVDILAESPLTIPL